MKGFIKPLKLFRHCIEGNSSAALTLMTDINYCVAVFIFKRSSVSNSSLA